MRTLFALIALTAGGAAAVRAGEIRPDLTAIDATLSRTAVHASHYPPRFSSPDQRRQVEAELRDLVTLLDAAVARLPDDPELLFRAGLAHGLGHHLDFPGAVPRFEQLFDYLLELRPDEPRANFYYGAFLAGTTARQAESLKYLKRAVHLGVKEAHYTLAFVCLSQHDQPGAVRHLHAYLKHFPADEPARQLLLSLESEKTRFESRGASPSALAPAFAPGQAAASGSGS